MVADDRVALATLRAAADDLIGPAGQVGDLVAAAVTYLDAVATGGLAGAPNPVAAVALTGAVFRGLSDAPVPPGLLASSAATYLALVVLDDQMDGDVPAFWADRSSAEIVLGSQVLILLAGRSLVDGMTADAAQRLARLHQELMIAVIEGQLRSEQPLMVDTTPAGVAATIGARSGAMLAGYAAMAAVAAGGTEAEVALARTIGYELGVARQHWNDVTELAGERTTDLRNGTATMATALALQSLPPQQRAALVARLRTAATDPGRRDRLVRDELAGAIGDVVVLVRLHLARARTATRQLVRAGMRHDDLDRLIESTTTAREEPPMTEPDRPAIYDQLRERFVADPEFRRELRADPTATLEAALGDLTDEEKQWVSELPDASTSDDDLLAQVRTGVGAW